MICVPSGEASVAFARGEGEAADAGDAGQRLAAKTQRGDGRQILGALDFAGGMAFEAEQRVIAAHAEAVVGDANQAASAGADFDGDFLRAGIEGIFDQFLNDAGRPLDHFAGGDLVGDLFGKELDPVHREASLNRESSNRCIVKAVCRQFASDATIHDSRINDYFASGSAKQKIAPRLRLVARPNAAAVVFDDFFADGKAEAGAVGLAEGGEGLKKLVGDFGRDAGAGVLDLGDDLLFVGVKAHENFAAVEHHVGRVVDEVKKNAAQPAGIKKQFDRPAARFGVRCSRICFRFRPAGRARFP